MPENSKLYLLQYRIRIFVFPFSQNSLHKHIAELMQGRFEIERCLNMRACRFSNRRMGGVRSLNEFHSIHKIGDGPLLVEESGFAIQDQFRNSGDAWREDRTAERHGFDQGERKAFALAGEHYEVGSDVEGGKRVPRNVSEKLDIAGQTQVVDQGLQVPSFGALARDATKNPVARGLQTRTGSNQKGVILDSVEPPDGQKSESVVQRLFQILMELNRWNRYANPLYQDFAGVNLRIMPQQKISIELGHREANFAMLEFEIKKSWPHKKIGSVQRQAVRNVEQPGRHHANPSCEAAVVNMDVAHVLVAKQRGKSSTKYGVGDAARALSPRLAAPGDEPAKKVF